MRLPPAAYSIPASSASVPLIKTRQRCSRLRRACGSRSRLLPSRRSAHGRGRTPRLTNTDRSLASRAMAKCRVPSDPAARAVSIHLSLSICSVGSQAVVWNESTAASFDRDSGAAAPQRCRIRARHRHRSGRRSPGGHPQAPLDIPNDLKLRIFERQGIAFREVHPQSGARLQASSEFYIMYIMRSSRQCPIRRPPRIKPLSRHSSVGTALLSVLRTH